MFYLFRSKVSKLLGKSLLLLMVILVLTLNFKDTAQAGTEKDSLKELKKISDVINLAKGEYYGSVEKNKVILKEEYSEATFYLDQAVKKIDSLQPVLSPSNNELFTLTKAKINQIARTIKDKNSPEIMIREVSEGDQLLETLAGKSLKEFPAVAPSLENGRKVFEQNCAVCHGIKGFGNGPASGPLNPKPANFHDQEFILETSPYNFYRAIKNGVPGTAMPSWEYQLSKQEKWDVISYVRSFSQNEPSFKKGEELYNNAFSGINSPELQKITDLTFAADKSDAELIKLLKSNEKFSAAGDQALNSLVNYIRNEKTSLASAKTVSLSKQEYMAQTISEIKKILYLSREKYLAGNKQQAVENAIASYMAFEPVERELSAKQKELSRKLELQFNELKGLYASPANIDKVDVLIYEIEEGLEKSVSVLTDQKDGIALLLQSLFLIMREGFEAIIVIMALITFVKRTGAESSRLLRNMYSGIGLGVIASIATAILLDTILQSSRLSKEFLEGITVLIAAAILFYVSHWLVSKTQAQQWQAFIKSTLDSALSSRNQLAIVSVGFLAVYREGFETILFYKALYTTSMGGEMITIGFILGCIGLAILSVLFYRFSVKIPVKEFFLVTGLLLYYMVFSFVGKGLSELQEGNLISITVINKIPEIDLIGLYPTLETTLAQLIVLLLWIGAVVYSFYSRPKKEKAVENTPVNQS
jgi:high-affinity iron transporter